jgi:MFS transporter, SHS family, lactate transporter
VKAAPVTPVGTGHAKGPVVLHSRRYLLALLGMLASATVFEGYDITILKLCTPDIARTFHLTDAEVGLMASVVRLGGMLSFFVVALADRLGRKPVISITVICYATFTLLTALSGQLITFTVFQSAAQIFLAAEFGVAVVIISEEFPDDKRGMGISTMHTATLLGVMAAGALYGPMAASSWGWRGMYLLGVAPALLIAFLRRGMRETARFAALTAERQRRGERQLNWREQVNASLAPLRGKWRGRLILTAILWNSIGIVGGPTITFFSLYAQRDHGWTSAQVGAAVVMAYIMGSIGSALAGALSDRVGRKLSTSLFYLSAAAAMFVLFHADRHAVILGGFLATMFAYQGARAATSALTTEMFPTEIRAVGFSLTVQVLGQIGWLLTPVAVGSLAGLMGGLGPAARLFAIGPVLGTLLLLAFIRETHGKTLEETAG